MVVVILDYSQDVTLIISVIPEYLSHGLRRIIVSQNSSGPFVDHIAVLSIKTTRQQLQIVHRCVLAIDDQSINFAVLIRFP